MKIPRKFRWAKEICALALLTTTSFLYAQAAGCNDWAATDFTKKRLIDSSLEQPFAMNITKSGWVYFIQRSGAVNIFKPIENKLVQAGLLAVNNGLEDGLLGMALDLNFDTNHFIYLYYTQAGAAPIYNLSRFTLDGGETLNYSSEIKMLTIKGRHLQIHASGSMTMDKQGNLYVSTGDNTNSHASDGYTPIDERPGQDDNDAQGTSGNTKHLLGKVLRIHPEPNGSYTIPAGNMFSDTTQGKPEIYAMGLRNGFRIALDAKRNWLYVGDVGADALVDNPNRGSESVDEVNQIKAPSNLGWPYFQGNNKAYNAYNFATKVSGAKFDPLNVTNNSPNNTGIKKLPNVDPAWFFYNYEKSELFPTVDFASKVNGRAVILGAHYNYNNTSTNAMRLPPQMDNNLFVAEYATSKIKVFKIDETGAIVSIKPFTTAWNHPIQMEIAPDGVLYVLEWGTENTHFLNNGHGSLSRIEYNKPDCQSTSGINSLPKKYSEQQNLWINTLGNRSVLVPTGITNLQAFNLAGEKIWEAKVNSNQKYIVLPETLAKGILQLRFLGE